METLDAQIYKFAFTILAGMLAGIWLDLFRAWRLCTRPAKLIRHVTDVVMVASVSCFVVALVIHGTSGEIRLYTLIAICLGLGLYFYLASPSCLWLFYQLLSFLIWLWRHMTNLVRIPITWLGQGRKRDSHEKPEE